MGRQTLRTDDTGLEIHPVLQHGGVAKRRTPAGQPVVYPELDVWTTSSCVELGNGHVVVLGGLRAEAAHEPT